MKKAIYKIENKINHKIYIGQSLNPEKRFQEHCYKHEKYISLINQAIQKYGEKNFSFEIIGWFEDYNEKEQYYIKYYRSLTPYGYNIVRGGEEPPHPKGETHPCALVNNETVERIKQDLQNWDIPKNQIIKKYHVTADIIRHINDGTSWYDPLLTYPLRPGEYEINEKKADKVIYLLQNTNLSQKAIGQQVGWNRSAVTMINIGQNHHRDGIVYPIRSNKKHYETCND